MMINYPQFHRKSPVFFFGLKWSITSINAWGHHHQVWRPWSYYSWVFERRLADACHLIPILSHVNLTASVWKCFPSRCDFKSPWYVLSTYPLQKKSETIFDHLEIQKGNISCLYYTFGYEKQSKQGLPLKSGFLYRRHWHTCSRWLNKDQPSPH